MTQDRLTTTFSALADPTRRAILARLALGEASVNELAQPFSISQPAVSKHLKVLEQAGLITRGREAQWRPCKLDAAALKGVADWLEPYRRFWEERFDRLDEHLRKMQSQPAGAQPAQAQSEQAQPAGAQPAGAQPAQAQSEQAQSEQAQSEQVGPAEAKSKSLKRKGTSDDQP
jgi:DNA-binding transcriptional ArsR family regulator